MMRMGIASLAAHASGARVKVKAVNRVSTAAVLTLFFARLVGCILPCLDTFPPVGFYLRVSFLVLWLHARRRDAVTGSCLLTSSTVVFRNNNSRYIAGDVSFCSRGKYLGNLVGKLIVKNEKKYISSNNTENY
jgi:hypothetical protein